MPRVRVRPFELPTPPASWREREASWLSDARLVKEANAPSLNSVPPPPKPPPPLPKLPAKAPSYPKTPQPHRLGEYYDGLHFGRIDRFAELAACTLQRAVRRRQSRKWRKLELIVRHLAAFKLQRHARNWLDSEKAQSGVVDLRLQIFTAALKRSMAHAGRRHRGPIPAEVGGGAAGATASTPAAAASAKRIRFADPLTPASAAYKTPTARRSSCAGTPYSAAGRSTGGAPSTGGGRTPRPQLLADHQQRLEDRLRGIIVGWRSAELVYAMCCWRGLARHGRAIKAAKAAGGLGSRAWRLKRGWSALLRLAVMHRVLRCLLLDRTGIALCFAYCRWRARWMAARQWWAAGASHEHAKLNALRAKRRVWVEWWTTCLEEQSSQRATAHAAAACVRLRCGKRFARWHWRASASSSARALANHRSELAAHQLALWLPLALRERLWGWREWARCGPGSLGEIRSKAERRRRVADALRLRKEGARAFSLWIVEADRRRQEEPSRLALLSKWRRLLTKYALKDWRRIHGHLAASTALLRVGHLRFRLNVTCRVLACLRLAAATELVTSRLLSRAAIRRKKRGFARLIAAMRAWNASGQRDLDAKASSERLRTFYTFERLADNTTWLKQSMQRREASDRWLRERCSRRLFAALLAAGLATAQQREMAAATAMTMWRRARKLWPRWRHNWCIYERARRRGLSERRLKRMTLGLEMWKSSMVDGSIRALAGAVAPRWQQKSALHSWRKAYGWPAQASSRRGMEARRKRPVYLTTTPEEQVRSARLRFGWIRWARSALSIVERRVSDLLRQRALRRARKLWRRLCTLKEWGEAATTLALSHCLRRRLLQMVLSIEKDRSARERVSKLSARWEARNLFLLRAFAKTVMAGWLAQASSSVHIRIAFAELMHRKLSAACVMWRRYLSRKAQAASFVLQWRTALLRREWRRALFAWRQVAANARHGASTMEIARAKDLSGSSRLRAALRRWRRLLVASELNRLGAEAADCFAAHRCLRAWRSGSDARAQRQQLREEEAEMVKQAERELKALLRRHASALSESTNLFSGV